MVTLGTVRGGVIVLDDPTALPEGRRVEVREAADSPQPAPSETDPSLLDLMKNFVGAGADLPKDVAEQHDHYAWGTPKR